jgi:AraC family transcriptional regulator of arabinose operon
VDARIVRVLEIVAHDLEKPHSLKLLAAQLRLSPSRFEHLFRKETGRAFKTFLRAARMKSGVAQRWAQFALLCGSYNKIIPN